MGTNATLRLAVSASLVLSMSNAFADGWDPYSKATEMGSIVQTRHNLTMSYNPGARTIMGAIARNDYGAICVYCHTPHGANTQIKAPLWNRTVNNGSYTTYDKPTTLMRPIGQPGPNSLTCLSCHDGTISIDSVLNMPGSGFEPTLSGDRNNQTGSSNLAFLNKWASNAEGLPSPQHYKLGPDVAAPFCTQCHNSNTGPTNPSAMSNFKVFAIGTDLRDDHPVGVQFPDTFGPGIDFNEPNVKLPGKMAFFDKNSNSHADPEEVRLYDTGDGYEVECASCHDPHGVESGGDGTRFNPSFLRVNNGVALDASNPDSNLAIEGITSNGASALCLTCHAK